jgi:hypothetical protein
MSVSSERGYYRGSGSILRASYVEAQAVVSIILGTEWSHAVLHGVAAPRLP